MSDASPPEFAKAARRDRGGAALAAAIATLKKRLATAQAERDGWHAAGNVDRCLTAGYMLEALRLQLQRLELAGRAAAGQGA